MNNMSISHTHKQTRKQKKLFLYKNNVYLAEIGRKLKQAKRGNILHHKAITLPVSRSQSKNFKKYKLYFKKKAWYADKAAPIPGGNQKLSMGFVKKHKKFYKNTLLAYKFFNSFYFIFNKKRTKKQFQKINSGYMHGHTHIQNSMNFSALMLMDSLFHSSMCKRALILKPQEKNITSSYFLNGKYVRKKNFVLYRSMRAIQKDGDFCIGGMSV